VTETTSALSLKQTQPGFWRRRHTHTCTRDMNTAHLINVYGGTAMFMHRPESSIKLLVLIEIIVVE
jgi:hypothetical protein